MAAGGAEAKRAFDAMMDMGKIDVAAIEAARLMLRRVWRQICRQTSSIDGTERNVSGRPLRGCQRPFAGAHPRLLSTRSGPLRDAAFHCVPFREIFYAGPTGYLAR
jgi:hypothetical protein